MKKIFTFLFSVTAFGAFAQGSNGTMETWVNYNAGIFPPVALEEPAGWHGSDSLFCTYGPLFGATFEKQVYKTTDKHSGTYAAMIMTKFDSTFGAYAGVLTNSVIGFNLVDSSVSFSGGYPVSGRVNYASAWIKYLPTSTDSADFLVEAVKTGAGAGGADSVLGVGDTMFMGIPNYTSISVPIMYDPTTTLNPDAIRITFTSSAGGQAYDSSMLYVDDVTVGIFPAGVSTAVKQANAISLYPNPATNELTVSSNMQEAVRVEFFDAHARLVYREMIEGKKTVDLSAYAAGQYFFMVHDKNGAVMQGGKFTVVK